MVFIVNIMSIDDSLRGTLWHRTSFLVLYWGMILFIKRLLEIVSFSCGLLLECLDRTVSIQSLIIIAKFWFSNRWTHSKLLELLLKMMRSDCLIIKSCCNSWFLNSFLFILLNFIHVIINLFFLSFRRCLETWLRNW
jgi:hypothetical protein